MLSAILITSIYCLPNSWSNPTLIDPASNTGGLKRAQRENTSTSLVQLLMRGGQQTIISTNLTDRNPQKNPHAHLFSQKFPCDCNPFSQREKSRQSKSSKALLKCFSLLLLLFTPHTDKMIIGNPLDAAQLFNKLNFVQAVPQSSAINRLWIMGRLCKVKRCFVHSGSFSCSHTILLNFEDTFPLSSQLKVFSQ